jgi:hypothetical protein
MYQNADYIYSTVDSISKEEDSEETISALEIFWKDNKKYIALSVGFQEIDKIEDLISNLRSAYDSANAEELEKTKALLKNASRLLTRYERFHLENLL